MNEVIELNNHRLLNGDATNREDVRRLIGNHKVNLLLTDPPYGISTTTCGEGASGIFSEFLQSIEHSMKEDALLVMASPDSLDIDSLLNDVGFELLERYEIKMHRSLTRIISVIAKIH